MMKLLFTIIFFSLLACDKSQSEIKVIERLSHINFPSDSNLLFYYDNLEFEWCLKLSCAKIR